MKETYQNCAANNDIVFYTITDGLHDWAGGQKGRNVGDAFSNEISATDIIREFFKAHAKN